MFSLSHSPSLRLNRFFNQIIRTQSIHTRRRFLPWKPRHEHNLSQRELLDRICRILVLQRLPLIDQLHFDFSDEILDAVLRNLRFNPNPCLQFFKLASKQQTFRPNAKSYCKIVHILSKARFFDDARVCLNELVEICVSNCSVSFVFDELVSVYREFSFSPTVFDMLLKVYVEKGLVKDALFVFDNMGKCGCVPSLRSCNALLSRLVRGGEARTAVLVYDQMVGVGVSPDIFSVYESCECVL
ncbi:hypothetical protein Scep_000810 [Stephania cephalantha]|uniref:Pentatricopeptide repeat-containing protein n=1 Tax=Stephania cephalantha TaxID=152367 RepID=A0AAP0LAJ8_9MAGN